MKMSRESRVEGRELANSALRVRTSGPRRSALDSRRRSAFTLVEVMIALGIFFMAMFAILGLVSNSLRNARALQRKTVDCGPLAAQVIFNLSPTNRVYEGVESGDFGDLFPEYEWTTDTYEVASNGLYQVDMIVQRKRGGVVESKTSILVFAQKSSGGSLDKGAR